MSVDLGQLSFVIHSLPTGSGGEYRQKLRAMQAAERGGQETVVRRQNSVVSGQKAEGNATKGKLKRWC